jgi:hypothetical protein
LPVPDRLLGKGRRGWPEGKGYLSSQLQIERLQIDHVVAEALAFVLDHQAGVVASLDLCELSISDTTKAVHQSGEAKITKTKGTFVK